MSVCCIRGAITVAENTKEEILENTKLILDKIISDNNIKIDDIISIIFTATRDIDAVYPAVAARELGIVDAALLCYQEMNVVGSLKMCIRTMVTVNTKKSQKEVSHIYLKGAAVLRPDIAKKNEPVINAVAIDGPAGSGKSTAARLAAKKLGYIYVDTGAMYRAVGLYFCRNGVNTDVISQVNGALEKTNITIEYTQGIQKIYLNGEDVSDAIRTQQAAAWASKVALIGEVRRKLVDMQRDIAQKNPVVMDGRDIGSNVLKNAAVKIYMDASVKERTRRRCHELSEKGIEFNRDTIEKEIIDRDNNDKNRKINPLIIADGAVVIDTSDMDIEQAADKVIEIAEKYIKLK